MTEIDDLKALIPSPSVQPARVASWPWYEDHAGIRFPTDYKAIVDSYGSGVFCDDVIVWTPVPWPGGQTILDLQHEQQDLSDIVVAQASAHDTQWAFNDGVSVTTDVLATELFAWGNGAGARVGDI
ncbi:hypothetical protein GCM10027169_01440 [Gordonia jinhuaensis]|uniref:SMI1/KNR4 family protein n=1 Tax=Gordonia jinhuaensis TaxID=1517702 RepID=A0A916X0A8_9ACTN|nr:hypothetical protein [Gordonia jinhuaensis]GGB44693.1 hypothetical protein GCM10011489_35200 [Gordonia jinhuaensis]